MKTRNMKKLVSTVVLFIGATILPSKASACSTDQYLGSVCLFGGNFAIRGYATAEGQLLSIASNSALFSLFGTAYGGDGRTTFALPDLRGRTPIGQGTGPGMSTIRWGQIGGAETHTLSISQIPSHNHTATTTVDSTNDASASTAALRALAARADSNDPTGSVLADSPRRENIYNTGTPNVDMNADAIVLDIQVDTTNVATTTVNNTGGNQSFSIRNPYLGMYWLVALQGVFPSRS